MDKDKDKDEYVPICPSCGTRMVREKKFLKAARIEVEVWVCPAMKTPSCTD